MGDVEVGGRRWEVWEVGGRRWDGRWKMGGGRWEMVGRRWEVLGDDEKR